MSTSIKQYRTFSGFIILSLSLLLFSCGNEHKTTPSSAQTGTVGFYVTDSIADYKQVIMGINKVSLVNSGTETICTVLTEPVTLDIPKLADVLQLVDVVNCGNGPYNRIHLEMQQEVTLMDKNGSNAACKLGSYLDNGGNVNRLQCDPATGTCTLDITGAVRRGSLEIFAGQANKVAVDFDLKNFLVTDFGEADCSVTMKVTPLHAADIIQSKRPETVSGIIADLDAEAMTFRLKKGGSKFIFSYAAIADAHPGLGLLLRKAQDDVLKVWIQAPDLGSDSGVKTTAVLVKVSGNISGLNEVEKTFTLTYKGKRTITVSYGAADTLEGTLTEPARAEVKLYDSANGVFPAASIKIKAGNSDSDN